jgi:outer membrane protein assembly factor BamB
MLKVSLQTGMVVGQYQSNDSISGAPYVRSDGIYFGCNDGNMYCLNNDMTLKAGWTKKASGAVLTSPNFISISGTDYIVFNDSTGTVNFVKLSNGSVNKVSINDYSAVKGSWVV